GAHLLSLEISDGANAFVREQHHRAVDAGGQNLDALVLAEGGEAAADRGVVHDLVAVLDIVEQAGRIEDLEARLEADPETVRRAPRFDPAERHAFHHRGKLAELVRRADLGRGAPPSPRLDASLESV